MYKILTEGIKMQKISNNINKHFNTKLSKHLIHRTLVIFIYYRTYVWTLSYKLEDKIGSPLKSGKYGAGGGP